MKTIKLKVVLISALQFLSFSSVASSEGVTSTLIANRITDEYEFKIGSVLFKAKAPENQDALIQWHATNGSRLGSLSGFNQHALKTAQAGVNLAHFHEKYVKTIQRYEESLHQRTSNANVEKYLNLRWQYLKKVLPLTDSDKGAVYNVMMSICAQRENFHCLRFIAQTLQDKYDMLEKAGEFEAVNNSNIAHTLSRAYQFLSLFPNKNFNETIDLRRKAARALLPYDGYAANQIILENQILALKYQSTYFDLYLSKLLKDQLKASDPHFMDNLHHASEQTVNEYLEVYEYSGENLQKAARSFGGLLVVAGNHMVPYDFDFGAAAFDFLWSGVINSLSLQNARRGFTRWNDAYAQTVQDGSNLEEQDLMSYAASEAIVNSYKYSAERVAQPGIEHFARLAYVNLYRDVRNQAREIMRMKFFFALLIQRMEAKGEHLHAAFRQITLNACRPGDLARSENKDLVRACAIARRFEKSSFFEQVSQLGSSAYLGLPLYHDYRHIKLSFQWPPVQDGQEPRWFVPFEKLNMQFATVLNVVEPQLLNEAAKFVTAFNIWMIGIFPMQIERFVHGVGINLAKALAKKTPEQARLWMQLTHRFPHKFGPKAAGGPNTFASVFTKNGEILGGELLKWLPRNEMIALLKAEGAWGQMHLIGQAYMLTLYPFIMNLVRSGVVQNLGSKGVALVTFMLVETADGCTIRWGKIAHDMVATFIGNGSDGVRHPSYQYALSQMGSDPLDADAFSKISVLP